MGTDTRATETPMTAKRKPIDYMTVEQMDAYALKLLVAAKVTAAKMGHGRWKRSKYTDAICNAGPNWHPGMPLPGIL